ncbi:MAG: hypothetical protein UY23_C0001G0149 [Candidatus Jorgensenbacteria bacterium GW2011_GWA1_48_11]|uniref:Uncharacterized protein n=1 Tax=Candidatus Jorgensenbacteria bacterium GW2011_GWA1_48_11 TaxID=1618660 RepID=A0A0G1WMI5_9BACT|nr:MAG: hypothetical protein UY23_C0001G0149 [Candidatus Jorgensenbacteria bacterium GW2011_GWA1_48_11]KKW12036.1 MAG: hypothetical protein UY51_C0005G0278 [Candidatus Jorgensenbacteria bacterium GW2011_GWB1_49_9]
MGYNGIMLGALAYLGERFFYRLFEFLRHWYVKSARVYSNFVIDRLERLDRYLAWRITLKNLFQPLYKDYSVIGYVLGFIFRFFRLIFGGFVYLIFFAVATLLYVFWILTPPYLVWRIIISF